MISLNAGQVHSTAFLLSKASDLVADYGNRCGAEESWIPKGQESCGLHVEVDDAASLDSALAEAKPGTCIVLSAGVYKPVTISVKGTSEHPIRIMGKDVSKVIFEHSSQDNIGIKDSEYLILEGITSRGAVRAGISVLDSSHIVVRNCIAERNGFWGVFSGFVSHLLIENNICHSSTREHGIYVSNSSDNITIRGNHTFANARSGIQVNADLSMGGDGIISDSIIEGNRIENNGRDGGAAINLDGVSHSIIRDNTLKNNHAGGIALFRVDGATGSSHNLVYENHIEQSAQGRWCVNINAGSVGNYLFENYLVTMHPFRGSIAIDESSRRGFFSFENLAQAPFSLDGEQSRISLAEWQAAGYGQGTKSPPATD